MRQKGKKKIGNFKEQLKTEKLRRAAGTLIAATTHEDCTALI